MKTFLFVVCFYFLAGVLWAQDGLSIIAVGEAETLGEKILIAPALREKGLTGPDLSFAIKYNRQLVGNFAFYQHFFKILKTSENSQLTKKNFDSPNYLALAQKSIRYLIHSSFGRKGPVLGLRVKAFDINAKKEIYSERFTIPTRVQNRRNVVHSLSDRLYRSFTGKASIFNSKIIFVSDFPSTSKKIIKELYIMDFDGYNKQRLTWHKGVVVSPTIDSDRIRVAYSLISNRRGKKNVNLRMLDLRTKKNRQISSLPGLNSGAIFSPTGDGLYLTMTDQGNAEIYEMDLRSGKRRRITRHWAEDVDPSINARGDLMAFLSGRPGRPMIYVSSTRGEEKDIRRVGHTGKFNATPRFAPSGEEIAFSSWVDNRFDIYRIGTDGNGLTRLTRNFGSNESPSYSGDGEFIVFTSLRVISRKRAEQNLYIMNRNGEILGAITQNFGKCLSPRWSK